VRRLFKERIDKALRKVLGLLALALTLTTASVYGSGLPSTPKTGLSDTAMEQALDRAIHDRDRPQALELVNAVLEDSLRHANRYGYYSRRSAFQAISDLKLSESAGLMRQLAAMAYEPPPPRGTADPEGDRARSSQSLLEEIAITGALDNLTHLGDPEASRLNRQRINSPVDAPLIRSRAIANLMTLKEWDATEDVRQILRGTEPKPEAILYLTSAVESMAQSPLAVEGDCSILPRLRSGYVPCFDPSLEHPGISGCAELRRAMESLAARLRCPA
jgi:hypothetical protein